MDRFEGRNLAMNILIVGTCAIAFLAMVFAPSVPAAFKVFFGAALVSVMGFSVYFLPCIVFEKQQYQNEIILI